jgi:hypothetical protein
MGVGFRILARLLHEGIGVVVDALGIYEQPGERYSVLSRDEDREGCRTFKVPTLPCLSVEREVAQHGVGDLASSTTQAAKLIVHSRKDTQPVAACRRGESDGYSYALVDYIGHENSLPALLPTDN